MKRFCSILLLAVAAIVGYRAVSDILEDSRDFR